MNELDFIRYITIKKGLAKLSVRTCKIRFNIINKWLKENNKELNKDTIEEFFFHLKERGLNNNSLNTYVFTCRYIQDYLLDRGIKNNFFEGFNSFTKVKPLIIILTPEEIERLLATHLNYANRNGQYNGDLNFVYVTFNMFLAFTGCRFSEAADLTVKRLDVAGGKATFIETKNKEIRFAHLTEPLISRLAKLCEGKKPDDIIFTNSLGQRFLPQTYSGDLRRRCKLAKITKRVHPHLFRHSFATQLLMSGVDVTMVASILGHKDIQTTYDNYVHLADDTLRKATYRHPLVRKNIDPKEIIKIMQDLIEGFKIDSDERFNYKFERSSNSLSFTVFVK